MSDPVTLLAPSDLRPTEAICPDQVRAVIALMVAEQAWTQPICVERATLAILDGHHRHAAALQLGLARVPVRAFDYAEVELASWRADWQPTREDVLRRARAGVLYPPKTTRHTFAAWTGIPLPLTRLIHSVSGARGSSFAEGGAIASASRRHADAQGQRARPDSGAQAEQIA